MSAFTCRNGHDMKPSDGPLCKKCGARVGKMDGKSERELRAEERAEDGLPSRRRRTSRRWNI